MLRRLRFAVARVSSLLERGRFESDLDDELRFHLEMETEKNQKLGMRFEEARARAVRSFGGTIRVKDEVRCLRGYDRLDALWRDLRYGARSLVQSPGFAGAVVLTLSLGIGANTAIFSVVYGIIVKPLPYGGGSRLVALDRRVPGLKLDSLPFSVREIDELREKSITLESIVEYHTMPFILLGAGEPERVQTGVVSASYFEVLSVTPLLGRGFVPADESPDAEPVLLLTHDYWRERYASDPEVVGRLFEMNDRAHRVVGVLPPLPRYPDGNDVFMPISACPFRSDEGFVADRTDRMMSVLARMKSNTTLADVRRDLAAIAAEQRRANPVAYPSSRGHAIEATLLKDELTLRARPTFFLLLATAGFVLLIACANVANIHLSRLLRRGPELALRSAIGASRGRIVCQLLTESTMLSLAGGALGVVLAWLGLDLLVGFASRLSPRASEIGLDGNVLSFALALSFVTAAASGAFPALAIRSPRQDRSWPIIHRAPALRAVLVVAELALSLTLLVGAGLMLRSVASLEGVDAGYRPQRVLGMLLDLDWSRYDRDRIRDFHRLLLDRVGEHADVISVAVGRTVPLDSAAAPLTTLVNVEGCQHDRGGPDPMADVHSVSEDYFETIGAHLVRGRGFSRSDDHTAPMVAILNLTAARRLWPGEDPIGRRVSGPDGLWHTVVGVVGDVRHYGLDTVPAPSIYVPIAQTPLRVANLVVRTKTDPTHLIQDLKGIVHALDPAQAVSHIQTLEEARHQDLTPPKLTSSLLAIFAALALLIAAFGLGGTLMLEVSARTRELGVRLALGASPARLRVMVLREGIALAIAGLSLGLGSSLISARQLQDLLFETEPHDPLTLVTVSVLMLGVAAIASSWAARRATAIDPLTALRSE
ncbi:MAG TPA: ABC transporter permease [Vicinamibacteria bacterium]|nr:ABC transporter permease [Vicinamibacteria bacterium]